MMSRSRPALAIALLVGALVAQAPVPVDGAVVPDQFIVLFSKRTFDLDEYRAAIYDHRPAAEVEAIVRRLETATELDQSAFAQMVAGAGGAVLRHFWIINGASVRLRNGAAFLRGLPNVASVTEDRMWLPWLETATDGQHHGGDQANQRTVGGVFVKGRGQTVAILDTGIDANVAGLNRPHAAFYPDGNTSRSGGGIGGSYIRGQFDASSNAWGTEDRHGHGTFVAGCAAANKWIPTNGQSDYGFAPEASIYNINVSSAANGGASGTDLITAWQHVAAQRAAHNITVANNSYSGSPSLADPIQVALDNVASNSNVLVVVAAGNSGTNTSRSQSAYNGLSVGALAKGSLAVASFSCTGPLNGSLRTYPDMTAVGQDVHSVLIDAENTIATGDGTSFASPMVAGAAVLVRQVDTTLTALETKALLLNSTNPYPNRNLYGLGVMRADNAVDATLAQKVITTRVTSAAPRKHIRVTSSGSTEFVTACWFRTQSGNHENIDIEVFQANGLQIATDLNPENSYGKVSFQPGGPGTFRAVVYLVIPGTGKTYDVAVAGNVEPIEPPAITSFTPPSIPVHQPPDVIVTGTDLDFVTGVTIGGLPVASFTSLSKTQLRFRPPPTLSIGTHNVVITTEVGSTPPTPISATGTHPALLTGPTVIPRGTTGTFTVYGERGWFTLLLLSNSNTPSQFPGVVDLEIGNFFLALWEVMTFAQDAQGIARFQIPIHATFPRWPHFFEVITFDPAAIVFPLETSNAHPWNAQ